MKKIFTLLLILISLLSFAQDRKELGNTFIKTLLVDQNVEKAHSSLHKEAETIRLRKKISTFGKLLSKIIKPRCSNGIRD